jgi:hypothetical protein
MVASENGPYLAPPADEGALVAQLRALAGSAADRKRVGQANRDKARAEYDAQAMTRRYHALYWGLMDRKRP